MDMCVHVGRPDDATGGFNYPTFLMGARQVIVIQLGSLSNLGYQTIFD
jgi:hypothetical protein